MEVKEITEQLLNGVTNLFESDKYKEYLKFYGSFYKYSPYNTLLIYMQKPDARLVAGFKAWQEKKRNVKKGEKSIKILAPIPRKYKVEVKQEDGTVTEEEKMYMRYRAVSVFDISQTDGADVPEISHKLTGNVEQFEQTKNNLIKIAPVPVKFSSFVGEANGYYDGKNIVVKNGMSEQQTVKTLVHEIAHSMMHGEDGEAKDADRSTKELQAESVAYIVCNHIGIDASDYTFGYIAGWSKEHDVKQLQQNLVLIGNTATKIIEAIA